ncbi:hypothetical protein [Vibrio parahaemolyticus]|uniref:hypothetical protein n=1 Tax=Vibrio parahaemolyticus TaxID=670 RepID=UPI003D7CED24|nr:hypothetical protein [Vibrio parahaemolyticus]MDG3410310.1 hypothetical protein [Vibrio parahaemolyticus]
MIRPNENPLMEQVRTLITDHGGLLSTDIVKILQGYTAQMELRPLTFTYHAVKYLLNLHYQLFGDCDIDRISAPWIINNGQIENSEVSKREKRLEAWLSLTEDRIRLIADCEAVCVEDINKHFVVEDDRPTVKQLLGQ